MYILSDVTKSLNLAWQGMLAIFIGMAIIYLAIFLLSKLKDSKHKN